MLQIRVPRFVLKPCCPGARRRHGLEYQTVAPEMELASISFMLKLIHMHPKPIKVIAHFPPAR